MCALNASVFLTKVASCGQKNTITFISGNKVICCGTESENEENTNQPDSILEQTIRDLVEENNWKCNYISKMKEENSVLESEALEMESKLNEHVSNDNRLKN
ncbi:hypothetical protein JTB14_021694 [Gonioctena quinquepunctata]|nr:hypothetical protein JTB14_021694 [Gonioctena quinquepunctata]